MKEKLINIWSRAKKEVNYEKEIRALKRQIKALNNELDEVEKEYNKLQRKYDKDTLVITIKRMEKEYAHQKEIITELRKDVKELRYANTKK